MFSTMFCFTAFAFLVKASVEIDSVRHRYEGLRQMIRCVNELLPRQSFRMWVSFESRKGTCCCTGLFSCIERRFCADVEPRSWAANSLLPPGDRATLWKELRPPRDVNEISGSCFTVAFACLACVRSAATTFPSADSDLLMKRASSILSAFFSASVILSLPARSIKLNLDTSFVSLSYACMMYCGKSNEFC